MPAMQGVAPDCAYAAYSAVATNRIERENKMNAGLQVLGRSFQAGTIAAILLLAGCTAISVHHGVKVALSGASEVPPVTTTASGSGMIMVGDDWAVSGSVTTTGIDATAAHIHTGVAGVNGPVTIGLDKTGDGVWTVPAGARFTEEQYKTFKSGGVYINVDSSANKAGEIRGKLLP